MVAVLKYNAGNVQSVLFALERLGVQAVWTDDPAALQAADKVIFPGQGEAALQQPVLGICIGLQLFCRHSEENDTDCLGIFDATVRKFSGMSGLKVPQMGWNQLIAPRGPLFMGVPEGSFVYFVHSYYAEESPQATVLTEYGERFSAGLQHNNFHAVQFHPEKSGPLGQKILQNFLNL